MRNLVAKRMKFIIGQVRSKISTAVFLRYQIKWWVGWLRNYSVWLWSGRKGFDSRQRIFPLTSASRPALGPTQPPVQWVPGVKRGRGVMLTTHPLLVPKLRKRGAIPPPCPSASMTWSRSDLLYFSPVWLMACDLIVFSDIFNFFLH
jgi:hypothetical protein